MIHNSSKTTAKNFKKYKKRENIWREDLCGYINTTQLWSDSTHLITEIKISYEIYS